jgi:hypothetical protein
MADDGFKTILIPSYLNPGETLMLVFTVEELKWARRRGEITIKNRMKKGMTKDEAIRSCDPLS